jgi:hypothetical protein
MQLKSIILALLASIAISKAAIPDLYHDDNCEGFLKPSKSSIIKYV